LLTSSHPNNNRLPQAFVFFGFFDDALLCSQLSIRTIVNVVHLIFHKS